MEAPKFSQESLDTFKPLFQKRMAAFAKMDPAIQQKYKTHSAKMASDEEYKAGQVAEWTATFKAADTDGNGLLNKATFKDFSKKAESNFTAKFGDGVVTQEEDIDKWFDAFNGLTPETDGISLQNVFMIGPLRRAIFPES